MLNYSNPTSGGSLLSAVSDPSSDLGRVCFVIDDLEVALRRADDGLADTVDAIERCRALVALFGDLLTAAEFVSLDTGGKLPDKDALGRLCLAERVLDYVEYDRSLVRLAYESVWSSREEFRSVDDIFVLGAETHLDNISLFPTTKRVPEEWLSGLWFGFDLIIRLSGVAIPSHSESDLLDRTKWFNDLSSFVNPSHPQGKWPSLEYGLTELTRPNTLGLLGVCPRNNVLNDMRH